MDIINQGRMADMSCVRCGKVSDAFTQVAETAGPEAPSPDSVIICGYCGQIHFWGEDGIKEASEELKESIRQHDPEPYAAALALERKWMFREFLKITKDVEL